MHALRRSHLARYLIVVDVHGFRRSGIRVTGSGNSLGGLALCAPICSTHHLTVRENGGHGIEIVGGAGNVIENTTITRNGGSGVYLHDGASGNRVGVDPNSVTPTNDITFNSSSST